MSCGIGKGWKRWRNQASASGKQKKQRDELKERFGHLSDPAENQRLTQELRSRIRRTKREGRSCS